MGRSLVERTEAQRLRTEAARLKVEEHKLRRALTILQKFDATDSRLRGQRKRLSRETKAEHDVESKEEASYGVAVGRDLQRNNGIFRAQVTQLATIVVGSGPKAQFNLPPEHEEWGQETAAWVNSVWAKECDATDDTPFAEMVANALIAAKREGDQLWVFDDFDRDDGTIRVYETDQMPTVNQMQWENAAKAVNKGGERAWPWKGQDPLDGRRMKPFLQDAGVVRDLQGRVVAYVAHNKYGAINADIDDVSIFPRWHRRDNPDGPARLFKLNYRPNQHRGIPEARTVANQQRDIYEMLAAELLSAKNAAERFAWVEQPPEGLSGVERAMQEAGMTQEQIDLLLYGDGAGNNGIAGTHYHNAEAMFGARMDYMNAGEKLHIHDHDRPSSSVVDAVEFIQRMTGATMGLARSRATMKADTSYTAFRGEDIMTYQHAEVMQKALERRLLDFVLYKAVNYGIRTGGVNPPPIGNWWTTASWQWPVMREVDELKTANAERIHMKNGRKGLPDILGPNWRNILRTNGAALALARELDYPLSVFESISGAELKREQDNNE